MTDCKNWLVVKSFNLHSCGLMFAFEYYCFSFVFGVKFL